MAQPASELKTIRDKLQEYIRNHDSTAGCLEEDVHLAFSNLRRAIVNLSNGNFERSISTLIEAADAAENSCRQRMLQFHSQQIEELQDVLCRGNDLVEHKNAVRSKSKEFDNLKIPEIDFSSLTTASAKYEGAKPVSDLQNTPELVKAVTSIQTGVQKSKVRSQLTSALNSSFSILAKSPSESASISKRPATSMGLVRTIETQIGTASPHVASIDAWPSQKLRAKTVSPFCGGESEFPNRGYTAGPLGFARLRITERGESLIDTRLPERVESYKPKELVRIERYIANEFTRQECSDEVFNEERFNIFREGFVKVIRVFRSWSPLLQSIQNEYDAYVSKLRNASERAGILEAHTQNLHKDYEIKSKLLRAEADKALEAERMRTTAEITTLSQDLNKALNSKAGLEDILAIEKAKAASLADQLEEVQRQQGLLLKGYADQMRDLNRMMDITGMTSINDVVRRFREMVHVHTVWEMETRLQVQLCPREMCSEHLMFVVIVNFDVTVCSCMEGQINAGQTNT